ncbi:MAG: hypothetical protein NTU53_16855 [Planctomycetota bacterium]|nr:hypothetical protein [Planctomycetota bacterium]
MRTAILTVLAIYLSAGLSLAQTPLPADRIRQGEAKQQQIKTQTAQVADQLGDIIDEFKRNGLDGEDVQILAAIRSILGNLSDKDMQRVIDLLQTARSVTDASASRKNVAGAVADQKYIVVQMRQLLLEYQRQQALYELSLRLAALAERQNGNLKVTVDLAKATAGKTGSSYDDTQRASLQVQQAEQQSLKDEANPILGKLETIFKDSEGTTKDRLNKALQLVKDGALKPAMDSAIEDLKAANLYRAAGSEKTVRDQLRELSRLVAPPKDTLAALRQAAAEIDKAIEQQKQLVDDTKKKGPEKDRAPTPELENRQADLVDKTDLTRKDLQNIAPDAAKELKTAQDHMQEARADLTEQRRDEAAKDEQQALTNLEAAKNAVQEAIAKAEPAKQFDDKLAAAKELQERTRELINKEEQLKADTKTNEAKQKELKAMAPKQGDLKNQTRELQKDAAAQVPEAAQPIGDAADQMDKSEKKLAKAEDPKTTQEAQAAAISSLKQADEALTKRVAELEKAKEELAKLEDVRNKIEKLIDNQQQVGLDTGKAAAAQDKKNPNAPAPKELANQQDKLSKDAQQAQNDVAPLEPDAAKSLAQAKQDMGDAKGKLDQNKPKDAQPPQKEAMADLFKAKDALDKRIEQLMKELGQETQNPDALADAASKIEQLKNEVAAAQEEMNGDPAAMAKSLTAQQKDIAEDLAQMNAQSDSPSEPMQQAQESADQAAQQLAQGQLPDAAKSMGKAQQAMQKEAKDQPQKTKLPKLAKKEAELKKTVEQLAQGQKPDPMEQASGAFEQASTEASELAAEDDGQLPSGAADAVEEAAQAMADASTAAAARNKPSADESAQKAQAALAKASAAMALAKAGLSGQMASAHPSKSQTPSEAQKPGQAKGKKPGKKPGPPNNSKSTGNVGSKGGPVASGPQKDEKSAGTFIGLPPRDRAAITQSQNDKYPQEYGAKIEQYLKNLADQEDK